MEAILATEKTKGGIKAEEVLQRIDIQVMSVADQMHRLAVAVFQRMAVIMGKDSGIDKPFVRLYGRVQPMGPKNVVIVHRSEHGSRYRE